MLPDISDEGGDDDEEIREWWGMTGCCVFCHCRVSRCVPEHTG